MYTTASLNDKIFLNNKGITHLQNLEEFTGLKALFVEGNGLESLEGLEHCTLLKCLFAQKNFLGDLTGVEALAGSLDTLNVSHNRLEALEGVGSLGVLGTLQAAHCQLSALEGLAELPHCAKLSVLDLTNNKIEDPGVLELLAAMPELRVLYLQGNPVVSKIPHYRKTMLSRCPGLTFLDDRPVFEKESRCAAAWAAAEARGEDGIKAEREERRRIVEEEEAKKEANFQYMRGVREAARRRRLIKEGRVDLSAYPADTPVEELPDEAFAAARAEEDGEDGGEYEAPAEPSELVRARELLIQSGWRPPPGEEEPADIAALR